MRPFHTPGFFLLLLLLAGLAAAWLYAADIAQWAALEGLKRSGYPDARLTVRTLDADRLDVTGIAVAGVSVDQATVSYHPWELLGGRIERITLRGPRVSAQLGDDGRVSLGALDPVLTGGGGGPDLPLPAVDSITLRDAEVRVDTDHGPALLTLDGTARRQPAGHYLGRFETRGTAPGGLPFAGTVTLDRVPSLDVVVEAPPLPAPLPAADRLVIHGDWDNGLARASATLVLTGGRLDATVAVPLLDDAPVAAGTVEADLFGAPGPVETLNGRVHYAFDPADRVLRLWTDDDLVAARGEATVRLQRLKVKLPLGGNTVPLKASATFDATLPGGGILAGSAAGVAEISRSGDLLSATVTPFETTMAAPERTVAGVSVQRPRATASGRLDVRDGLAVLTLDRDAEIEAEGVAVGTLRSGPLRARIPVASGPVATIDLGTGNLTALDLRVVARPIGLRVAGEKVAVSVPEARVSLADGDPVVEVDGAAAGLPDRGIAAADVAFTVRGRTLSLARARIRHPSAAPVTAAGRAVWADDGRVRFSGRLSDPSERVVLAATGQHDPDSGRGHADLDLAPVTWAPGTLQPADLVPALAGVANDVRGTVRAAGPVSWGPGAPPSALAVTVEDGAVTLDTLRAEGIAATVVFDRPWPLATPPGQRATASRIVAPVPLTDADVTFHLETVNRLVIEDTHVRTLGGTLATTGVTLDPAAPLPMEATVEMTELDLSHLIAFADRPDVSGEGRLTGRLPVSIDAEGLTIHAGTLTATGPGVVRYRPASPPTALADGGDGVGMMLSALENFQYEDLAVTVDRDTAGQWSATLHLKGANPDRLDGQLFEFNINLSGALDQILRQSLDSWALPERIVRGLPSGTPDPRQETPAR